MSGHQTATLEDTVFFWFAANDTSGSGGDGATPLFDVREAGAAASAIPLLSGTPDLLSHANFPAGCYEVVVAATAANGFAADDTFAVFCTLAIDAQNPSGLVGSCTLTPLAKAAALATAQADLDIITGAAGALLDTTATSAQLVDDVMDEVLTGGTHNVVDSLGRRIRDLQEFGVYEGGAIWIDTVNGTAGTTDFESGTAFNPVDSIADTNTLLASLNLARVQAAPNSSFTFVAAQLGQLFMGRGYTVALGGQNINNTHIVGADVSGIGTAANLMGFIDCVINTASLQKARCVDSSFTGIVTQTLAGDYRYVNCQSGVAGSGGPTFTKTAGQAITMEFRRWSGSVTISGLESGDVITVGGADMGTITLNGADAQVEIRGVKKALVNNLTGAPTVNDTSIIGPMRGTDSAALASVATEARLAELDAANMPADIDAIPTTAMRGTDNAALASVATEARLAELDAANLPAGVDSAVALFTTQLTEAYAADGVAPTPAQALFLIQQMLTEFGIAGTTLTVRKIDGAAVAATFTLDDGTNPTDITRAT